MTDRELLEFAAKAAGLDDARWLDVGSSTTGIFSEKNFAATKNAYWNPLEKDGDAFRLMVDLRLDIEHNHPADKEWVAALTASRGSRVEDGFNESGRAAATRRAIVRVAADIGRGMG